jgi:hydrogenase expression/formation protein HypC
VTAEPPADQCAAESGHCITCGDEGVLMWVVSVSAAGAVCRQEDGTRHEGIAVDLVEPVGPGDPVLVHAGVAIA